MTNPNQPTALDLVKVIELKTNDKNADYNVVYTGIIRYTFADGTYYETIMENPLDGGPARATSVAKLEMALNVMRIELLGTGSSDDMLQQVLNVLTEGLKKHESETNGPSVEDTLKKLQELDDDPEAYKNVDLSNILPFGHKSNGTTPNPETDDDKE